MKLNSLLIIFITQLFFINATFAAEPISRLFSTPSERSHLEALRKIKKEPSKVVDERVGVIQKTIPIQMPEKISMQGYVKRSDGKQGTVWVNGHAMQENSHTKDVQVGKLPIKSNRVPMRLQANGKRITLKAGQVYHPHTNKVQEIRNSVQGDVGRIGDATSK